MYAFIRKNYLTINENPEIWELVDCTTGGVIWFGTEAQLTQLLGDNSWDTSTQITYQKGSVWAQRRAFKQIV